MGRVWLRKLIRQDYLMMTGLCLLTAGLTFLPTLIANHGLFSLVGDFNYQQIPFNILSNRAIKTGAIYWNWYTDLGSNFIGSYSFYTLGSPFFWLSLLFPPFFFQYLVGPMFILKYCVAGLTAFTYLRRYVRDSRYAMIGALLYAFSGFSTVNLMFNHFHDVVAFFPLLLAGLDRLMLDRRYGWFAAAVALTALVNFFFFAGELVFLVLYFCVRFLGKDFRQSIRRVPAVLLEGVLGVGMAGILLLPAVFFTLQNPRLDQLLYGPSALAFDGARYLEIIKAILMPADIMPHQSAIFPSDFTSSGAYLPLFGPVAAVSFILARRGSWQKRLMLILLVMALVPLLNSFFYLLNGSYYARWFYMPVLISALMTVQVLEKRGEYPAGRAILLVAAATALLAAFLQFYPWSLSEKNAIQDQWQFLFYLAATAAGLILSYLLLVRFRDARHWMKLTLGLVILFAGGLGLFNITATHKIYPSQSPEAIQDTVVKTGQWLTKVLPKSQNYRVSISDGGWNLPMVSATPTVNSFTSMVNGSIFQFYQSIDSPREVKTIVPDDDYGLVPLLSNRFFITTSPMSGEKLYAHFFNGYNDIYVYENADVLPIGFTYNYFLTEKQFAKIPAANRHYILLKAVIIPQNQEKTVSRLLSPLPKKQQMYIGGTDFLHSIAAHRQETATDFRRNSQGFTATIRANAAKYAFFSVPFDKGWSASVNGRPVRIINSDGLMIVPVDKGTSHIQFRYRTPGLKAGIIVSALSLLLFFIWRGRAIVLWIAGSFRKIFKETSPRL